MKRSTPARSIRERPVTPIHRRAPTSHPARRRLADRPRRVRCRRPAGDAPAARCSRATPIGWTAWCARSRKSAGAETTTADRGLRARWLRPAALCLHSDIDLLIVAAEPIGARRGAGHQGAAAAAVGPPADGRPARARARRLRSGRNRQCGAAACAARPPLPDRRPRAVRTADGAARVEPRARAACLAALLELTDARHARFNRTIYQLEPDVKDAPGGLRDLDAVRFMRLLRPAAFSDQPGPMRSGPRRRGVPVPGALGPARDQRPQLEPPHARAAGSRGRGDGLAGAPAQQRVEALMSEYFGRVRPVARSVARFRAALEAPRRRWPPAASAAISRLRTTGYASRSRPDRGDADDVARGVPRRAGGRLRVSEQARTCIEQNVHLYTADDFVGTEGDRQQLRGLLVPRAGSLRPAVGDARLRPAGLRLPGVRARFSPASSATSTIATRSTSTRS